RHLVAAGCDPGDRLEHGCRLIDRDLEPFGPEVALVLGEEKGRSQTLEAAVEGEPDVGLRGRGPSDKERERGREQERQLTRAREVTAAHAWSFWFGPHRPAAIVPEAVRERTWRPQERDRVAR